jgi:3-hydroxyacyl-[acyl-carrier-protein] dehydratase
MKPEPIECRVPATHPALPGHFPGQPIVPGVLLLALVHRHAREQLDFTAGASQWRRVKFLAPVVPEQGFLIELEGDHQAFRFSLRSSDNQIFARGQCRHDPLA